MFKWFRKFFLKGLIKDLLKEVPNLKTKALKYFEENQDEIMEQVKQAIKKTVLGFSQKNF